jgi:3-deoxy-D-manno-octulosonic-acid transferase
MADTEVLLLDTLGELNLFYAAANVAFVAGSLKPIGGHNVLEPAMLGKPVLVGPEVATVRAAVDLLRAAGALEIITDGASLVERLCFHAESPASSAEAAAQGLEVLSRNRGCTARAMAMIDTVMSGRIT